MGIAACPHHVNDSGPLGPRAQVGEVVGLQAVEQRLHLGRHAGEVHRTHHDELVGGIQMLAHLVHVVVDDAMVEQCPGFRHRLLGQQRIALLEQVDGLVGGHAALVAADARPHLGGRHRHDGHPVVRALLDTGVEQLVGQRGTAPIGPTRPVQNHSMHEHPFRKNHCPPL